MGIPNSFFHVVNLSRKGCLPRSWGRFPRRGTPLGPGGIRNRCLYARTRYFQKNATTSATTRSGVHGYKRTME